ncbi:MAG: glutathione S-transferase family protein [Oscillatoriales cyanobacterium]|nr:MAG: glutathione S-transferase family protein [Oscillatoriales cyanobacterium]
MIILHTAPGRWGLASVSPACMELETWLRIAQLPYKTQQATVETFAQAPYGKIPFIDYQGQRWGDTGLIIEMLRDREGIDLDAGLSPIERAISLAFKRLVKEHLYWGGIAIRYLTEENWQQYQDLVVGLLPAHTPSEEATVFANAFRQTIRSQMVQQGLGRLTDEARYQMVSADLQALSDFLGDKPFLMGDRPTTLDATVYGHVGNFIQPPYQHPIVTFARQQTNLCAHYERMTRRFFSELMTDRPASYAS